MLATGWRVLVILVGAAVWGMESGLVAAQERGAAPRQVSLTFDDLPLTGGACEPEKVRRVTWQLTHFLEERSIPAAGLVTGGAPCVESRLLRETLERWVAAGAVLGNHGATHLDLNDTPPAAYLADVDRGQALLEEAVGTDDRWFRPPYLHTGDDTASKAALLDHLAAGGYRMAAVTIDNQEWVYAAVYADARERGDARLADRVAAGYVGHLEASMAFYESLSRKVFNREIPQVLLLHANELNAERLPEVVAMLEGRGYRFVGLREAVADSAYDRRDPYVGPRGLSWLQRWAMDAGVAVPPEPREAAWVAEAFHGIGRRDTGDAAVPATIEEDENDRSRIAAAGQAFSRAYVAGDTAAIRDFYTPDAVLLPPDGEVRGRDAIVRYYAPGPRLRQLHHAMISHDLRVVGDLAVDAGTWTNTVQRVGQPPREASGRYLVVWRRSGDGRWRIEYDVWHRPTGR